MTRKNKSGAELAKEYFDRAKEWKARTEASGTAHEYVYGGRVKRREFAKECDFSYSVCTQNGDVRKLLESCDLEWFGTESVDKAAENAANERADKRAQKVSSDNSKLKVRVAELEAENKALKKQLKRYQALEAVVQDGMAGFGVIA